MRGGAAGLRGGRGGAVAGQSAVTRAQAPSALRTFASQPTASVFDRLGAASTNGFGGVGGSMGHWDPQSINRAAPTSIQPTASFNGFSTLPALTVSTSQLLNSYSYFSLSFFKAWTK